MQFLCSELIEAVSVCAIARSSCPVLGWRQGIGGNTVVVLQRPFLSGRFDVHECVSINLNVSYWAAGSKNRFVDGGCMLVSTRFRTEVNQYNAIHIK